MALNVYSLERDGEKSLSKNFKVREFRCKDGSDPIFIDSELVEILQKVRDHFGSPEIPMPPLLGISVSTYSASFVMRMPWM